MVTGLKQFMTAAEFDRYVAELEGDYEYIAGEVLEVVSNNFSSQIAAKILIWLGGHILQNNLGHVTGADGGYVVNGERYIPDVGYISRASQPAPSHDAYNPNPPELAVEVVSPTDNPRHLLVKVSNYLAAGTIVWVVYPEDETVHVHHPQKGAKIIGKDDKLTCDILPDFELAVKDIFPKQNQ